MNGLIFQIILGRRRCRNLRNYFCLSIKTSEQHGITFHYWQKLNNYWIKVWDVYASQKYFDQYVIDVYLHCFRSFSRDSLAVVTLIPAKHWQNSHILYLIFLNSFKKRTWKRVNSVVVDYNAIHCSSFQIFFSYLHIGT